MVRRDSKSQRDSNNTTRSKFTTCSIFSTAGSFVRKILAPIKIKSAPPPKKTQNTPP